MSYRLSLKMPYILNNHSGASCFITYALIICLATRQVKTDKALSSLVGFLCMFVLFLYVIAASNLSHNVWCIVIYNGGGG